MTAQLMYLSYPCPACEQPLNEDAVVFAIREAENAGLRTPPEPGEVFCREKACIKARREAEKEESTKSGEDPEEMKLFSGESSKRIVDRKVREEAPRQNVVVLSRSELEDEAGRLASLRYQLGQPIQKSDFAIVKDLRQSAVVQGAKK